MTNVTQIHNHIAPIVDLLKARKFTSSGEDLAFTVGVRAKANTVKIMPNEHGIYDVVFYQVVPSRLICRKAGTVHDVNGPELPKVIREFLGV